MIHDYVEDYVDDLVVKSRIKESHLDYLREVFERCRKCDLKMNPLKCAFGVTEGKFLRFMVHKDGIKIDEDKAKAIMEIKPPQDLKQLRGFIGKISYLRRFILALANIIKPLHQLTKKDTEYKWGPEHDRAFEEIKKILTNS